MRIGLTRSLRSLRSGEILIRRGGAQAMESLMNGAL